MEDCFWTWIDLMKVKDLSLYVGNLYIRLVLYNILYKIKIIFLLNHCLIIQLVVWNKIRNYTIFTLKVVGTFWTDKCKSTQKISTK